MAGRVVVLTGAAGGIGAATARALASRGARLVLMDVTAGPLAALASELGAAVIEAAVADVRSTADVERVGASLTSRGLGVDVLINNAGVYAHGPLIELPEADFAWTTGVNVEGMLRCCRVFVPLMTGRARPQVINVLSVFGVVPAAGKGAYCVSKAAGFMLSACLREELAPRGIAVTEFVPPAVNTNLIAGAKTTDPAAIEREADMVRRHAAPAEVVAGSLVGAIERPRRRVVCGLMPRAVMLGAWLAPRLTARVARGAADRPRPRQ